MEQRELPKNSSFEPEPTALGLGIKSKVSKLSHKLFIFTKFVLGLLFLPIVYSVSVVFLKHFGFLDKEVQGYFWQGIIIFLGFYLFVWEPYIIYTKGQKITEFIFNFLKPLVRVAPFVLPVYTLVLLVVYGIVSMFTRGVDSYFVFLLGFTMMLHLVFSAKTLRGKKEDSFKSNYILGFSLIYILNIFLLAATFSVIFTGFSFLDFSVDSFKETQQLFGVIFRQLFVVSK